MSVSTNNVIFAAHPMADVNDGIYCGHDISKHVYCCCWVEKDGVKYFRYLDHNGWSRCAYFFINMDEALRVFELIGNKEVPQEILKEEIKNAKRRSAEVQKKEFTELMDQELFE